MLAALIAAGHLAAPVTPMAAQTGQWIAVTTLYVTPEFLNGSETSVHVNGRNFQRQPYQVTHGTVSPPFSLLGNPFARPDATIVLRH